MFKLISASLLVLCILATNLGCTTSFLSPADGMGVQAPKIKFRKTWSGLEAEASSNFKGHVDLDAEYNKGTGDFKGHLIADIDSDASTVIDSQVEKIKALEAAYAKYADNMTALGIAQAQAWSSAFQALISIIPNTAGAISNGSNPQNPNDINQAITLFSSLTPEQKKQILAQLSTVSGS